MSEAGQISLFDGEAPPRGSAPETGGARTGPRPGEAVETAVPVAELNAAARVALERAFGPLWVAGEIANWRRVGSGHCYFSLRDETAQLDCVMFRSDALRLPTSPEEGMEVCAFGQVSLYEARGRYQLLVRKLEARGEGLWRLAFERLRKKLAAEGLLDPERKRPIPGIPERVGVVTSRTGAAVRDVLTVIRRRAPWTHILVSACRVQGEAAAGEIVRALSRVTEAGVDVVILTRGGGSVEDLWCFNDERLARAIAACPVPVISAVGHEVDVTIADLVADVRAPTPSAAGELAVRDAGELHRRMRRLADALVGGLRERTKRGRERALRAEERLFGAMERRLERWEATVARLGARLETLSPLATLRRGYAVPLDPGGRVLRRLELFETGEPFHLRVVDGTVACRTEGTRAIEEPNGGE